MVRVAGYARSDRPGLFLHQCRHVSDFLDAGVVSRPLVAPRLDRQAADCLDRAFMVILAMNILGGNQTGWSFRAHFALLPASCGLAQPASWAWRLRRRLPAGHCLAL
jgi:hypothetical protein